MRSKLLEEQVVGGHMAVRQQTRKISKMGGDYESDAWSCLIPDLVSKISHALIRLAKLTAQDKIDIEYSYT